MVDFNNPPKQPDPPGGKGTSYLSPTQENKLIAMALNPRKRFRLTRKIKRQMIDASVTNLGDDDGRIVNGAVANLIKMESLNQKDEHLSESQPVEGSVTNQQINIYLPSNGRESTGLMNGTNGNGKH